MQVRKSNGSLYTSSTVAAKFVPLKLVYVCQTSQWVDGGQCKFGVKSQ